MDCDGVRLQQKLPSQARIMEYRPGSSVGPHSHLKRRARTGCTVCEKTATLACFAGFTLPIPQLQFCQYVVPMVPMVPRMWCHMGSPVSEYRFCPSLAPSLRGTTKGTVGFGLLWVTLTSLYFSILLFTTLYFLCTSLGAPTPFRVLGLLGLRASGLGFRFLVSTPEPSHRTKPDIPSPFNGSGVYSSNKWRLGFKDLVFGALRIRVPRLSGPVSQVT